MRHLRICAVLSVLLAALLINGFGGQSKRRSNSTLELNGVRFTIPSGLVQIGSITSSEVIFLFRKEGKEGTFISVPSASFDEDELANRLLKGALEVYFPKELKEYRWRPVSELPKVSRFETRNGQTQGFNKNTLIAFQYRRIVFQGNNLLIGDIYEIARGKDAEERIKTGSKTISMRACDTDARIIYSITGEKYDEGNPPCQLIAIPQ